MQVPQNINWFLCSFIYDGRWKGAFTKAAANMAATAHGLDHQTGTVICCNSLQDYNNALQAAEDRLVVIDCYAEWCPPCRQISPVFQVLAADYPTVIFIKLDIDKVPELKTELGIWAMPTFVFFKYVIVYNI